MGGITARLSVACRALVAHYKAAVQLFIKHRDVSLETSPVAPAAVRAGLSDHAGAIRRLRGADSLEAVKAETRKVRVCESSFGGPTRAALAMVHDDTIST